MNRTELQEQINRRWPGRARCRFSTAEPACEVTCNSAVLAELCGRLFLEWEFSFAGLIVEEDLSEWQLRYCFHDNNETGWVHLLVSAPISQRVFPSIVKFVH